MDSFFSEVGISALDFVHISVVFFVTMLSIFGIRDKKWLHNLFLVIFFLLCMLIIAFHDGLPVKIFATLMLTTALASKIIMSKRRKLEAEERLTANSGT